MKKNKSSPPPKLEKLLGFILPNYAGHTALGDFAEEYNRVANIWGNSYAKFWYLFQIIKSIPSFIGNSIRWGLVMFKNYMKVTLRTIRRHKAFSFINIVGLAVGMTCVVILMLWVRYELSFERHHHKAERIFRVASESHAFPPPTKMVVTPPPMAKALNQEFPEIETSARLSRGGGNKIFSAGNRHFFESFYAVDPSFFQIFTFDFVEGDPGSALSDPYSIVLSEDQARKFFDNQNAVGRIIQFDEKTDLTVTGVIKNIPANSHLTRDIFMPFETWGKLYEEPLEHWQYASFYTYVLLGPDANVQELESKFPAFTEKHGIPKQKLFLQPLLSIHLHSHFLGELSPNARVSTLLLFGSIALLILIIACINYMNLTTARSSVRLKEVGARKVVGASRNQVSRQFLGESLIMASFSLVISFFLIHLFLPLFNSLAERQLVLNGESLLQILPGILLLVLFVGILAGSYPAFLMSAIKPAAAFKGSGKRVSQKGRMRNVLVIAQFSVSLTLIIAAILVRSQLDFIRDKDMGFDRDQIVVVPLYENKIRQNPGPVLEELRRHPQILFAASSMHLPNDVGAMTTIKWQGKPEEEQTWVKVSEVGYDFTEVYGINILQGRSFSQKFPSDEKGAFLVNESARKIIGDDFYLGMGLSHWGRPEPSGQIVGIMKDFHLNSIHEEIKPLYIYLNPNRGQHLSIKIRGEHIPETIGFIQKTMNQFSPQYPFEYRFFDDLFNMAYSSEQKMEKIFGLFATIAVFIACMGVFGLSAFLAEQKRKEIGIRKVLGASVSKIVYLLSRDLMWLVLVANLIAWPVAYYAMSRWLQNFAYRTHIQVGSFLQSSILIFLVSLVTLCYQTVRAARANPVDSLKYE
jgi:putative ABC transport system permease protein